MLACPSEASATGAYRLSWEDVAGARFRLTEGDAVLYEGDQAATTVSGRPAGTYAYRLVAVDAAGAETVAGSCIVAVAPPSPALTAGLMGAGFVVFAATTALVLRGHRAHRRGELG